MIRFSSILTIPNILTIARLFMLIPMLTCLHREQRLCVLAWGLLGILSDLADGWIARKFNQSSDLGRILDPIVDKVTIITVTGTMILSRFYAFPAWYFLFLVSRELFLLIGGWLLIRKKRITPQADKPGKRSAFATGVMVLLFILDWQPWAMIMLGVSFVMTIYSTYFYIQKFYHKAQ